MPSRRHRLLLVVVLMVALAACSPTGTSSVDSSAAVSAHTVAPDLGSAVAAWRTMRPTAKIRAILASVDGRTVVEKYYDTAPTTARDVESVTKSVVTTLVGIAIHEGLIGGLDATLGQLLPARKSAMRPAVAGITLRQLLTMTGGFPGQGSPAGDAFTTTDDWVAAILASDKPTQPPEFVYSNGSAHLVSAILEQTTGVSVLE